MERVTHEHISRDFETELRELRAQLLAMGARCERIVALGFEAYVKGTPESLAEAVALDAQIDRDEIDIHGLIFRILALRQPVAGDLRFLAAALRLITDLERVGDEAVNIAERAAAVDDGGALDVVVDELRTMAYRTSDMLHLALDAFVRGDDAQASEVPGRDDEVDRQCVVVITRMTRWLSEHASSAGDGLRAIRVAKYLERIGDHATNVAEHAIFMVRGEDLRRGRPSEAELPEDPAGPADDVVASPH
ncbi:MAG: phosphate signaling complex protein PhoU [Polyangiaceae bacterium]